MLPKPGGKDEIGSNHRHLHWRAVLCFGAVIATLIAIEVGAKSAILLCVSLVLVAHSGASLLRLLGIGPVGAAVCVIVGIGFFVIVGQLLLVLHLPSPFAHWTALVVAPSMNWWSAHRGTLNQHRPPSLSWENTFLALGIGVLVLSLRHVWLIPLVIGVMSAERISRVSRSRFSVNVLALSFIVVGAATSILWRPQSWWKFYQGNDSQFFESVGWSIARWTIFEHPGFAGGTITDYHWLTYGFFGALGEIAQLQPWDGLMKFGLVLLPALLALMVIDLNDRIGTSSRRSEVVLVVILVASIIGSRVDSFNFSVIVACAFLVLSQSNWGNKHESMKFVLFILMSVMLTLSKASTAAVVGAILFVIIVISGCRRERYSVLPLASLATAFGVVYILAFRGGWEKLLGGYSFNLATSANEFQALVRSTSIPIHVVIWIALWISAKNKQNPQKLSTTGIALFLVSMSLVVLHVAFVAEKSAYFAFSGVYLFSFQLVKEWGQNLTFHWADGSRIKTLLLSLAFVGSTAVGLGLSGLTNRVNSLLNLPEFVEGSLSWVGQSPGLLLLGTGLLFVIIAQLHRRDPLLSLTALLLGLGVSTGELISDYRQNVIWGAGVYSGYDPEQNSSAFGSDGLDELSEFVRTHTPESIIIASNNFCCSGDDWFSDAWATESLSIDEISESTWGGANYLLPANTQRRFLVQGLRFQTGLRPPTQDQLARMRVSLAFANHPTQRDLDELKGYGVVGFIVNLSQTQHRDWSFFTNEKFRKGLFIYLELK